jgi:hypothetical protein
MPDIPEDITRQNTNPSAVFYYGLIWAPGKTTYLNLMNEHNLSSSPSDMEVQMAYYVGRICLDYTLEQLFNYIDSPIKTPYLAGVFMEDCGSFNQQKGETSETYKQRISSLLMGFGFACGLVDYDPGNDRSFDGISFRITIWAREKIAQTQNTFNTGFKKGNLVREYIVNGTINDLFL